MDLNNPKKILVVQIGKIGDMILSTPLFTELKKLFPESELTVLSSDINKDIALNHKSVDNVIVYRNSIPVYISLMKSFSKNIDIWIDCKNNYSRTSEILVSILNPKLSLGFNFKKKIFDVSLNGFTFCNHAVCINLSPLNYFKKTEEFKIIKPDFCIPQFIKDKFEKYFNDNKLLNLVINVSAGNESRYLDNEKWLEIILNLTGINKFNFYLIGLEKDRTLIDYLINNSVKTKLNFIKTIDILETSEVIRKSDIVLTADTSIVHICSTFNIPLVGIYPDLKWNLEKFKPLSDDYEVVVSQSENSIREVSGGELVEKVLKLSRKIIGGNAESRTRVRKEDH